METIVQDIITTLAFALGFAVAGGAAYLVKVYLLPWIQSRIGADNFKTMVKLVRNFMAAAEVQIPGASNGEQKAEWVIEQVTAQLEKLNINIEPDVIRAAIDGSMAALENENIVNRK